MHTSHSAAEAPRQEPVPADPAVVSAAEVEASAEPAVHEPVIEETRQEVSLQRSVRYGRVLVVAAALGAVVAALLCLLFPIAEDAEYTMGQVVGFMALIGAAVGLGLGGLLSVALGLAARRRQGSGVAIQTDVR